MEETYYEMDLPRENIHLRCFAHSIMNYRYHWHPDEYELSIVLKGNQEYCRGTETHSLFEDDLILTAPGNGHASMRQQPGIHGKCNEKTTPHIHSLHFSFLRLSTHPRSRQSPQ